MDAEPGGILYLQEFFSDSVNEITFNLNGYDELTFRIEICKTISKIISKI